MNSIITEDIINKAINESIDEFMLEEGFGDTLKDWGQKVKGWGQDFDNKYGNRFSKAWNGLKNGVKAYMDYRTNGQWNREYNSYVNANSKFGEMFYLDKWLRFYNEKLNDIISSANNPSRRDEYEIWERDPNNPNKETKKIHRYDYVGREGALMYAKQYCTFSNFNNYVKSINPDRENVKLINSYIFNYITKIAQQGNIKQLLNNLNISSFHSSPYGKKYAEMNRNNQQTNEKNRRQTTQDNWNASREQARQNQQQSASKPTPPFRKTSTLVANVKGVNYYPGIDANNNKIYINANNENYAIFQ